MEQIVCNLCGSADAIPVFANLPDLLLERKDVWTTLVKCCSCGLIYQNPRPTLAEMSMHYPPEYESYALEPAAENISWLRRQAIQYGIAKRGRFITRHRPAGRLLDVGCAAGTFLRGMESSGKWQVAGVEISEYAARIARERYRLDVRVGTLEQAGFPDEFFDAITLWDVLEHLHDPAASLREVCRILKPDGLVVIRVPNASSWDAALFGRYWAGLDAPRHLYVFTQATLGALLAANGLRAKAWSSNMGAYTTFLLSLRFWTSAQRKPGGVRNSLIRLLDHPVTRLMAAPVFYPSGLALHGPLLVVTAVKRARPQDDRNSSSEYE